jgi:hypothetical protein
VPSEGHAKEDKDVPEWELGKKYPKHVRPVYVPMKDVMSLHKWYAHDRFKPKNQLKQVKAHAFEEAITSKLHLAVKKYPDIDAIKWSKDCPKTYESGKLFLQN